MPDYAYSAKDKEGQPVEGLIYADNSALALGKIRELGYTPDKVRVAEFKRVKPSGNLWKQFQENFILPVNSGVPLKDLATFYRQLATMISSGISLIQSLQTLQNQTRNPKLIEVLQHGGRHVENGRPMSEVFASYPWIFNELQIEMLKAAEQGGMMDRMLLRIADYCEQELKFRRMISRLTLYPKMVLIAAWFILGVRFFVDGLPAFSKLIIGAMKPEINYSSTSYIFDTAVPFVLLLLAIFGVVAFCRLVLFQSDEAAEKYEMFKMSIPGLGKTSRQLAVAKFGRAFGAMYSAGLGLNTAVRVAGNASGSRLIARASRRAIYAAEKGAPLSMAFREAGVFPPMVIDMLTTGEQTGRIDEMMSKMADYLESEAETRSFQAAHIFAAVLGLIVGILVGIAIIRFYMGLGSGIAGQMNEAGG